MNMEKEPAAGFKKLNFLISNPPFPPETFVNLMLLYCKHQYYDLAADVLAENSHLTFQFLSPELYDFLDATLMVQTAPEEVTGQEQPLPVQYQVPPSEKNREAKSN